jgi:hypothetical protein
VTIGAACMDAGGCWLAGDTMQCLGDLALYTAIETKVAIVPGRFGLVCAGDGEAPEFLCHALSELPEGDYEKREITKHVRENLLKAGWVGKSEEGGVLVFPFSALLTDGHSLFRMDQSMYLSPHLRWSAVGSGLEIGMGAAWVLERLGATPERLADWVVKAAIHNVTTCGGVVAREFFPAAKFRIT